MKNQERKQVPPMCRNCLYAGFTINYGNPEGHKREYFCNNFDGSHGGISLYSWEHCSEYRKKYHRNKQLDIQDAIENFGSIDAKNDC